MNEEAVDFADWFAPNWRFYELGEWQHAISGEIVDTKTLFALFKQETE